MDASEVTKIWKKHNIIIEGEDLIPPIETFKKMGFPKKILKILK
jgi:hypothetical protein